MIRSLLWGNMVCRVKVSGNDLSRYSYELNRLVKENVGIITNLIRKRHRNKKKYLSELVSYRGG